MDISIITVTYNSLAHIGEQIMSVQRAASGLQYEHIMVDNASTDGTVAFVRENFPEVRVIENSNNRGFGRANNQGVEVASAPYLLFLNPDTQLVGQGDLATWVKWMGEHPLVGIAGPKLVTAAHELNLSATPRRLPRVSEMMIILLKLPHLFPGLLGGYLYRDRDFTREQPVDSVRGSCLLMRRTLVTQLGFAFDPRYFIWFEDVDTCREALRLGWQVMYTPMISCVDHVGQSFAKKNLWWKQKQIIKSMMVYYKKWGIL